MFVCMKKIDTVKITGKMEFTIKIEKEDDGFVGYVLENHVSSFGDTVEEALAMTQEALALWIEGEVEYRLKKIAKIAQGYVDVPKSTGIKTAPSFQLKKKDNYTYTA